MSRRKTKRHYTKLEREMKPRVDVTFTEDGPTMDGYFSLGDEMTAAIKEAADDMEAKTGNRPDTVLTQEGMYEIPKEGEE